MSEKSLRIAKALSEESRFAILKFIHSSTTTNCGQILEKFSHLSQPTISHHLKILDESGIILTKKQGTGKSYKLQRTLLKKHGFSLEKIFS